jgi:predicted metal-dependent hydrolase
MIPGRTRPPVATESVERVELAGGFLAYTLRRSRRARRLRLVVDPRRGVVVTIPAGRPGARDVAGHVEPFLRERERWVRAHLARHERERSAVAGAGPDGLVDGARIRYRGIVHRLRVEPGGAGMRRSAVLVGWSVGDGTGVRELVLRVASADRRSRAQVLEGWLRARAAEEIDAAIASHAPALGVRPAHVAVRDARTRWGSAARTGRLAFSWRLILAPPEALETVVVHELAHLRVFGHGPGFWAVVASRVPDHVACRRWLREHSVELHATLAEERTSG